MRTHSHSNYVAEPSAMHLYPVGPRWKIAAVVNICNDRLYLARHRSILSFWRRLLESVQTCIADYNIRKSLRALAHSIFTLCLFLDLHNVFDWRGGIFATEKRRKLIPRYFGGGGSSRTSRRCGVPASSGTEGVVSLCYIVLQLAYLRLS